MKDRIVRTRPMWGPQDGEMIRQSTEAAMRHLTASIEKKPVSEPVVAQRSARCWGFSQMLGGSVRCWGVSYGRVLV